MRLHLTVALVLALAAPARPLLTQGTVPAPGSAAEAPSPEVVRTIAEVEARLESALAKRDRSALEQLVAKPFTRIHGSDGRVDSRETWLASACA